MLLTRKSAGASAHSSSSRLSRSLSGMLAKTLDRRAFLKRSGVAAGAGAPTRLTGAWPGGAP